MSATGGCILYERPPSISSGKSLEQNLVIRRRSDVLLEEQVENVRNIQDALQRVLTDLDHAKTKEEQDFCRSQADELKKRCEEMMLVLKIITKINTELSYARVGLQRALQTGSNINIARKRVNWLEDKMEHLLGKDKQRRPSRAHLKNMTPEDQELVINQFGTSVDYRHSGSRGISEFSSIGAPDLSTGDSSEPQSRHITGGLSTHSSQLEQGRLLPIDLTMDVPAIEITVTSQKRNEMESDYGEKDASTDMVGLPDTRRKWSTVDTKLQPVSETQDWSSSSSSGSSSSSTSSSSLSSTSASASPALQPTSVSQYVERSEEEGEAGREEEELEERKDASASHQSSEETETSDEESDMAPIFLTEDDVEHQMSRNGTYSHRSRASHVTLKTPAEMLDLYGRREEAPRSPEPDEAMKYWNSEHHRFEFSEYTDVLLNINPLSYHQMGLAVPGTFVDDVERDATLPWRPLDEKKAGAEVVDIHKQALDKLSLKLNKMYSKVKEASMLSVERQKKKEFGAPTLLQNLEDLVQRESTVDSSQKPGTSKTTAVLQGSREHVTLPPLENDRIGSSFSGRLVYYPKPLSYPEKLPLTRLDVSKQFPPTPQVFSESVPGKDLAAERFVNQRNLYKETKFTSSLFRSKHNKQKKIPEVEKQYEPVIPCQSVSPTGKRTVSLKSTFKMAATTVKLGRDGEAKDKISAPPVYTRKAVAKWKDMKPKSGFLDHSGLKWERVKNIVHNSLESENVEERTDAARHLGMLKCGDAMVNYALKVRLQKDPETRVVYESAKSLISLGCWDEEVVEKLIHFLKIGNSNIRIDLLRTIKNGKNAHYVDKRLNNFLTLIKIISILCMNPNPEDELSFQAAVCLGKLCVVDSNAVAKLRMVMETTTNTHDRAQALTILVHQMNEHDPITVRAVLDQLRHSPAWKHRKEAAKHLIIIGGRHIRDNRQVEDTFELLLRRLWDEPNQEVRQEVAKALAAQELYARACEKVEKCLSDSDENIRAQAVISIGTLGMKAERIIRSLLEMMELDSSDYVRLLILRTFGVLNCTDKRLLRLLRDKEKGDGPLARESKKILECLTNSARNGKNSKNRKT